MEKIDKDYALFRIELHKPSAMVWQDWDTKKYKLFVDDSAKEKVPIEKDGFFSWDAFWVFLLGSAGIAGLCSIYVYAPGVTEFFLSWYVVIIPVAFILCMLSYFYAKTSHSSSSPREYDVDRSRIIEINEAEATFLEAEEGEDSAMFYKLALALFDEKTLGSTAAREFFDRQIQKKEFSRDVEAQVEKAHLEQRAQSAQLKWEIENELDDLR